MLSSVSDRRIQEVPSWDLGRHPITSFSCECHAGWLSLSAKASLHSRSGALLHILSRNRGRRPLIDSENKVLEFGLKPNESPVETGQGIRTIKPDGPIETPPAGGYTRFASGKAQQAYACV